jgi:hypothetical protein
MKLDIRPSTLRDLTYTCANCVELDREEILAAGPRNTTECAWITHYYMETIGGFGRIVWIDDNPEFALGFVCQSPLTPWLFSAFAWGSAKKDLCMIELARWAKTEMVPLMDECGIVRVEARSSAHHYKAHRWLEWCGFIRECELPEWGRDGMKFVQYAWLRSNHSFDRFGNVARGGRHGSSVVPGPATVTASPDH